MSKPKLIRVTTVPISMNLLLKNQLRLMNNSFDVIGVSSYDQKHFKEVETREGVKMYRTNLVRKISPINDLITLFQLVRIFRKEKPEIVHSITPKAGLLSMLAAKMAGVPIRMHTFTGLIFPSKTGIIQKLLIKMDQLLCWAATDIYPEGKGVRNDLGLYNITKKNLKIIGNGNVNGVDLNYFSKKQFEYPSEIRNSIRKDNNINKEDFVFCFVGRFAGDKGINELVTSFLNIAEKYNTENAKKSIYLILVGLYDQGDMPTKISVDLIENHNAIKNLGRFDDIRPYLLASEVLVLPSYREGFPNVVLQAGAMELPSIVTNINGCNEIITEGENGLIIPVKNTERLTEAMETMINNDLKRLEMGKTARQIIVDKFEQTKLHQAILDEYMALLNKKLGK